MLATRTLGNCLSSDCSGPFGALPGCRALFRAGRQVSHSPSALAPAAFWTRQV